MTKRIYKLRWIDPYIPTDFYGQIVVAGDVPEARKLASEEANGKGWLDSTKVTCTRLGTTMSGDNRSRVVLIS